MKIGYILRTFPQLSETFVIQEIKMLEKMGHKVAINALFRPGDGIHPSLNDLAARTHYWHDIDRSKLFLILLANCRFIYRSPIRYFRAFYSWAPDLGIVWVIKMIFLTERLASAGITHLHTHFAWEQVDNLRFIQDVTGIPFSLTVHAADIYSEIYRLDEALAQARFVVTISEFNRQYLIKHHALASEKCHVIHCGIDPMQFFNENVPMDNQPPVILSIGRLVEKKGFDILLRGVEKLVAAGIKLNVKIIGDGPLKNDLKQLRAALGLEHQVQFLGSLPHDAVKKELKTCDIFVLACRQGRSKDIDGIPVVLMEAMAAGRPVVSTRLSGIPELIEAGTGLLTDPEDEAGIAEAIKDIISNPDKALALGKAAASHVSTEFSLQGQVEGLIRILK
jgi:colanic acid/amylovoran biosynthesis glycosyltransferase